MEAGISQTIFLSIWAVEESKGSESVVQRNQHH
jgi:hypothetical protein